MDYTIDDSVRRQLLIGRIQNLEAQHYSHVVDLKIATAWPEDAPGRAQQIKQSTSDSTLLESAIATLKAELAALPPEVVPASTAAAPAGDGMVPPVSERQTALTR